LNRGNDWQEKTQRGGTTFLPVESPHTKYGIEEEKKKKNLTLMGGRKSLSKQNTKTQLKGGKKGVDGAREPRGKNVG